MAASSNQLKRYQLQWRPSFPYVRGGGARLYVLGEKLKYVGSSVEEAAQQPSSLAQDPNTFSLQEIIRVAYNSTLILPFNTGVALAQEYSPSTKNKVVQYNTLGGNSLTTFGQAMRQLGMRIKIIKAGRLWEIYEKGLEALTYLSANQGRFYGGLYLIGYDEFADGTEKLIARYKVVVSSLDFTHRSDQNTTMNADLQMYITHDYGQYQSNKSRIWGAL